MICYERSVYTEREKLCLQELIRKYGMNDINRFMGNLSAKQEAWANLTKEFNSIKGNSRRTQAQLRKFWSNHRTRKKSLLEAGQSKILHTGAKYNPGTVNMECETSSAGVHLLMESRDFTETACDERSQPTINSSSEDPVGMSGRPFFTEKEKLYLEMLVRKYSLQNNSTFKGSVLAKRQAWNRLVKEFNSKEYTTRRSERQLKKCWDNLKSRRKTIMVRQALRTQTEVVPTPESEIPCAVTVEEAEDPLESNNDEKRIVSFETMSTPEQAHSDALEVLPPEMVQEQMLALNIKTEPPHTSAPSSVGDNDHSETQEFQPLNHTRIEEREEELHRLKVAERKWLVKAAEEIYIKARIERESAEELLRFRKAKREEAERKMNQD